MLCFVFAALVVLLDQLFKRWIVITLAVHENITLIDGVIGITHVKNTGAAFSILSDQRWILVGIAFVACILLVTILLRYNEGFWGTLGLAALLGGAAGNLIDRLFYGYVVDMFEPLFINFAIFNIADIFITLGGITFCVFFIATSFRSGKSEAGADDSEADFSAEATEAYNFDDEADDDDFDRLSDTRVLSSRRRSSLSSASPPATSEPEQEQQDLNEPEQIEQYYYDSDDDIQDYYECGDDTREYYIPEQQEHYGQEQELPDGRPSALDALGALESELSEADLLGDYDVDELLRKYGFEDDSNKNQ